MSLLTAYREGKALYRKQKALASTRHAPHLRVDISPAGVATGLARGTALEEIQFQKTTDYAQALGAAAELIRTHPSFHAHSAVLLNFWPYQVSHRGILIGAGQPFQNAAQLDACVQQTPEALSLDPNYVYRIIDTGFGTRVDCVGISTLGWEEITQALRPKTAVRQHWGPLAALEAFYSVLEAKKRAGALLLGIVDLTHLSVFALEGGRLRGVRVVERSQFLQSHPPLVQLLHSFGLIQETEILFIHLTQTTENWEALQESFSGSFQAIGIAELLKFFPQLEPAKEFPMFPIGLLTGGVT